MMADVTEDIFTEKFTVTTGDTVTLSQTPTKIIVIARGNSTIIDYTWSGNQVTFTQDFGIYLSNERVSITYAV